jgi:hypothetical protein
MHSQQLVSFHVINKKIFFKAQWLLYVTAPLAASGLAVCIYGFLLILGIISDYFLKHRYPVDLRNGEVWCSL